MWLIIVGDDQSITVKELPKGKQTTDSYAKFVTHLIEHSDSFDEMEHDAILEWLISVKSGDILRLSGTGVDRVIVVVDSLPKLRYAETVTTLKLIEPKKLGPKRIRR